MSSENTHNTSAGPKQESAVAYSDLGNDVNPATQKDPPAPQEPQPPQQPQAATESYDDYIKNLPPPFWQTKSPQAKPANDEAVAAKINAVCAPVTAEQREEDKRLKDRSWRERWNDRKARKEEKEKNRERDSRPVERGSRAQLNVFGSNLKEKKKR